MTLWLILTCVTTAALSAAVWSFVVRDGPAASANGAAGVAAARIKIPRRLLRVTEISARRPDLTGHEARTHRLAVLATALVLLPTLAGGMYFYLGSPAAALEEHVAEPTSSSSDDALIDAMVVQVEGYLKDNPNDGHGWETLAPIYMRLGKYKDSVRAWQNAIANLGDSADREENLGESIVATANGLVTNEAKKAFDKALSIDHENVAARFYIGLAAKQGGRRDEAAKIWGDLIHSASPDAEWTDTVRDALARLDEPSAAATDNSSPSDKSQTAMIQSMVDGLAARLKTDSGDIEGWLRLVRSYAVLGDRDKADAAVADARTALATDSEKSIRLEKGLKNLDRALDSFPQQDSRPAVSATAAPPQHDNATMQATVDKLAERLRNKGGDIDSWLMLVRSYEALGRRDDAMAAVAQARLAFAADPKKLSQFDQSLRTADGISNSTSAPQKPKTPTPTMDDAPADQQMAMINGMVDRLAERLKRDGHDVDGWIQLMRSYVVLGQRDQASTAGQNARIALGNDSEALRRLNTAAKELGVSLP